MVKKLWAGDASAHPDGNHLQHLQKTISLALVALWVTGAAIIALDVSVKGWSYFLNPKLQAKLSIVVLLTLNGMVLHSKVMPLMKKAGSLLNLSGSQRRFAIFIGVISGVSWLYAVLLGMGHALSWKYSLLQILIAYPFLIAGGFSVMLLLTKWSSYRVKQVGSQFPDRYFSRQFRTRVAVEAMRAGKTLHDIAQEFGVHPTQVLRWKKEFLAWIAPHPTRHALSI
ncbi:MAG: transposase [Sulfuriferula sp.]